jgi:hypothetical protein
MLFVFAQNRNGFVSSFPFFSFHVFKYFIVVLHRHPHTQKGNSKIQIYFQLKLILLW